MSNKRLWIGRADLIGDCVTALPMLKYFEDLYPKSYKYWPILRKISQAAPLFFNHPLIDKIVISDFDEGFGQNDKALHSQCDIGLNVRPQHKEYDWYNYRHMVLETWTMAGLKEEDYNSLSDFDKQPYLVRWWNKKPANKTIAVHCFAGYGRDNQRNPTQNYWEYLIDELTKLGFTIIRLGHSREPNFLRNNSNSHYFDLRKFSFIEQIQMALDCNLYIGTDSGFSLCVAAYYEIPQITILCNWNINHTQNFTALEPLSNKNITMIGLPDCDQVPQIQVIDKVKLLI